MNFSKELVDEFKELFKRKYKANYTDDEAQEAMNNLTNFFSLLLKVHAEQEAKKNIGLKT